MKAKASTPSLGCAPQPTPRAPTPHAYFRQCGAFCHCGCQVSGCGLSFMPICPDAEPAGQSLLRRPRQKRTSAEQLQTSLFHSLEASLQQSVLHTLAFFSDLKDFLASHSNGLSCKCLLSFLTLLPCFLLQCLLKEGETVDWPARVTLSPHSQDLGVPGSQESQEFVHPL